jgi:hypothetical protein
MAHSVTPSDWEITKIMITEGIYPNVGSQNSISTTVISPDNGSANWMSNYQWLLACVAYLLQTDLTTVV